MGKRIWQNITPSSETQEQIKSGKRVDRNKPGKASPRGEFPRERRTRQKNFQEQSSWKEQTIIEI